MTRAMFTIAAIALLSSAAAATSQPLVSGAVPSWIKPDELTPEERALLDIARESLARVVGFCFTRNAYHSLKSPLCSCVSITLPEALNECSPAWSPGTQVQRSELELRCSTKVIC
jgi:hypothetical protein